MVQDHGSVDTKQFRPLIQNNFAVVNMAAHREHITDRMWVLMYQTGFIL
jgi:hypothetical protein